MTDEEWIKAIDPHAVACQADSIGAYHRWSIRLVGGFGFHLGGGNTPEDAWHNAAIHRGRYRDRAKQPISPKDD